MHFFLETQNYSTVCVGRDLKDHIVPSPLLPAGTISTMLHPPWLWKPPEMGKWSHCIHHCSWFLVIWLLTRNTEWTYEGQKTCLSKMLITKPSFRSRIKGKVKQRQTDFHQAKFWQLVEFFYCINYLWFEEIKHFLSSSWRRLAECFGNPSDPSGMSGILLIIMHEGLIL